MAPETPLARALPVAWRTAGFIHTGACWRREAGMPLLQRLEHLHCFKGKMLYPLGKR
ncbi:hypothetical protein KL86DES1_21377 [uncultured Desulfovibrio sp.]|uniref:Uncharacterized protein n=1 Tax=uncultured Desulfovibrio sp. TaxID=167968 RepID=A0A212L7L0_9BACT|nr:hypothetical protein KL86DES1_21377 [uncultured Desulfovibrio sp.]VZH34275.1 conserved protein of unknown function [Desulfovibrio sp. 86]